MAGLLCLRKTCHVDFGSLQIDTALQLDDGNVVLERPLVKVEVFVQLEVFDGIYVFARGVLGVLGLVFVETNVDFNERKDLIETEVKAAQQFEISDKAVGRCEHVLFCFYNNKKIRIRIRKKNMKIIAIYFLTNAILKDNFGLILTDV